MSTEPPSFPPETERLGIPRVRQYRRNAEMMTNKERKKWKPRNGPPRFRVAFILLFFAVVDQRRNKIKDQFFF